MREASNCARKSVAKSHQEFIILGLFQVLFQTICPHSTQTHQVGYFYQHVRVEPSFPYIPLDVEDVIVKPFRLIEEREISAGEIDNNTINDESDNGKSQKNETGLEMLNRGGVNLGGAITNTVTAESLATAGPNSERGAHEP